MAEYVVSAREALEMDQQDLVAYSGVSQSVVSKIENARPDNGRFARDSLRLVALALLEEPMTLIHLARGLSPEEARAASERYWDWCEENGGWENFHKVPMVRPDGSIPRRRLPRPPTATNVVALPLPVIEDVPMAATEGKTSKERGPKRKRPSPPVEPEGV